MIVDFHTHMFPDAIAKTTLKKLSQASRTCPFTDGTAVSLRESMCAGNVDLSVVLPVATRPGQVRGINHSAAAQNQKGEGILSFGCIHPDCPDWKEELTYAADLGLKGIKIHPVYQGVPQDDLRYLRILEKAGELDLIVVTHGGIDIGFPGDDNCSPRRIWSAVRQVGPVKLVAAHMGGWKEWEGAEELLIDTQVYLDTSFSTGVLTPVADSGYTQEELTMLDADRFVKMVRSFGARRILFGTDSPWSGQRESIDWIAETCLTAEEKTAILGENAKKLLNL